jgi:hypothetical protein
MYLIHATFFDSSSRNLSCGKKEEANASKCAARARATKIAAKQNKARGSA